MREVKLEELVPMPTEFELASTGQTYRLRRLNLEDEVWVSKEFGPGIARVLMGEDLRGLARVAFRLLEKEDQDRLVVQDVEIVDEDGNKKTERVGGVNLLMRMFSGPKDKEAVIRAIWQTMGVSRPLQDEIIADAAKGEAEKKSQPLTGERSSTPSPTSTDGPSIKSEGAA